MNSELSDAHGVVRMQSVRDALQASGNRGGRNSIGGWMGSVREIFNRQSFVARRW